MVSAESASGDIAAGDDLPGEPAIGLGTGMGRGIARDRLTGHSGVGELDGPPNLRVVELIPEGILKAIEDLSGVQSPVIDHGGQDSIDLQPGIETITDPVHGLHQESNAAQGEELGLQRDDDAVGGGQSVE